MQSIQSHIREKKQKHMRNLLSLSLSCENNIRQLDEMLVEELYNKHHDDEQQLEVVDLDEMMMLIHLLMLMD